MFPMFSGFPTPTPQKSNIDTKKLPCLKGPVTFSKAHHFGALQPLGPSGGVPTELVMKTFPTFLGGQRNPGIWETKDEHTLT